MNEDIKEIILDALRNNDLRPKYAGNHLSKFLKELDDKLEIKIKWEDN